jgi:hypothetical protein
VTTFYTYPEPRPIVLAQARRQRAIEASHESLTDGYHAYEPTNGIRWTDGEATVPPALFAGMSGPGLLILQLGGTTLFPDEERVSRAA